jgi:hypothetical protein
MARRFGRSYADAVDRRRVPFLWLCGPPSVGKSVVGYEIFMRVYGSGIKAGFLDFDQVGLCYPVPADDPLNHHVKAQNLAAVWPTYRAAGARCLIAVGSADSRETVSLYADTVPDTDLTLCRLRATPERLTERIFRRGVGRGPVIPGPPPTTSKQRLSAMAAKAIREAADMDAADFADLCIDTDNHNAAQVAHRIRTRTNGWPRLAP